MNETEIRERLLDLAADAPQGLTAPPQLLRRARRRRALTLASSAVIVLALVAGGIAGVRWLGQSDRQPADRPGPVLPELRRDGEIITVSGSNLIAVDPRTGNRRIVVASGETPRPVGNAVFSPDGRWLAFTSARDGAPAQLFVLPADGPGESRRLTELREGVVTPEWSSDSTRIAFAARGHDPADD